MNRGNALNGLKRFPEALACYDRAIELDPRLAAAWYNKGDELGRQSRIIEARACFENARELGMAKAAEMVRHCEQILANEFYG